MSEVLLKLESCGRGESPRVFLHLAMGACPEIGELERFVVGQLDEPAAASVSSHVKQCAECAQQIGELKENLELAASLKRGSSASESFADEAPTSIGPYRILRKLGEGGMGTVYEAEQENPRRIVALKVIRPGLIARNLLNRFRHESQVLGRLQHPGIAQIYEAGTHHTPHGDQPYFVMELVHGPPLLDFIASKNPSLREILELLARICDAVEHAHQKGVIHRDLKPDNILIDDTSSVPAPKILDFGVARIVDPEAQTTTLHTHAGQIIGTVAYMSPEQASGIQHEIDTRSDVYALGVIAYQAMSGKLPYKLNMASIAESVRSIVQDDPTPLSTINRTLRGDVTTIVGKAMSKEKSRRYQSAAEMAADIRRHLRDEPISAHPPSTMYQLQKFARRNKGLVSGIVAAFIVLILGIIGTSVGLVHAQRARAAADRSAESARREASKQAAVNKFLQDLLASANPKQLTLADRAKGKSVTLADALDAAARKVDAGSLKSQPEIEMAVRHTLAVAYEELGDAATAEKNVDRWLELARTLDGAESKSVAEATFELATVRDAQGKQGEAESLVRDALAMNRKLFGDESEQVATCMTGLGVLMRGRGDTKQAQEAFRRAMEIRSKLFGSQSYEVAEELNNLGLLAGDEGNLPAGESLQRKSLDIRLKLFGEDHPDTAAALNNLAIAIRDQDRFAEAEPLFRKAIDIRKRLLGDDHPDVAVTMNNLASLLQSANRLDEAEVMYRQTMELQRKIYGDVHPNLARTINNLASLYLDRGKPADAEPLYRQSLAMRQQLYGDDHIIVAKAMGNLSAVLRDLKKFDEAEQLAAKAAVIDAKHLGEDHPETAGNRMRRGICLFELRRYDEAEKELLAAHRIFEPRLASGDTRDIRCVKQLVALYGAWNKPEKKAEFQRWLDAHQAATSRAATTQSAR